MVRSSGIYTDVHKKTQRKTKKIKLTIQDTVDHADGGYEDLLLTGLILSEVYDDDDPPKDAESDGFESVDDGGGFDGGGFDGGGFDGGGFE